MSKSKGMLGGGVYGLAFVGLWSILSNTRLHCEWEF